MGSTIRTKFGDFDLDSRSQVCQREIERERERERERDGQIDRYTVLFCFCPEYFKCCTVAEHKFKGSTLVCSEGR